MSVLGPVRQTRAGINAGMRTGSTCKKPTGFESPIPVAAVRTAQVRWATLCKDSVYATPIKITTAFHAMFTLRMTEITAESRINHYTSRHRNPGLRPEGFSVASAVRLIHAFLTIPSPR